MSDCVSNIHKTSVPATVHGMFASHYNAANNNPDVWYCDLCAATGEAFGMFTPDPPDPTQDPEGRALVKAIHERKNSR